jgi:hypothetical protein
VTAALLRLADAERPTTGTWVALAAGGATLALIRSLSPAWLGLIALLAIFWIGRKRLWQLVKHFPVQASLTCGTLLVAIVLNRMWEAAYGPTVPYNSPSVPVVVQALGQFTGVYRQEIGIFGYLETSMSSLTYKAWTLALTGLFGLGLLVGTRRERRVLVAGLIANGVIPALLLAVVLYRTGFGVQGRHVLPFAVALPLFAGHTLVRNRDRFSRLRPRHLVTYAAVIAAGVQLAGWYANARRHAVGTNGPIIFFGQSQWHPPLGYSVWAAIAALGALGLVVAGVLADRVEVATATESTKTGLRS